jgi:hypothetical protein
MGVGGAQQRSLDAWVADIETTQAASFAHAQTITSTKRMRPPQLEHARGSMSKTLR